jgi:hypothetical protein
MGATNTFVIVAIQAVVVFNAGSASAQTLRLQDLWAPVHNRIDTRAVSAPNNPQPNTDGTFDVATLFSASEPPVPILSLPLQPLIDRLSAEILPRLLQERDRLSVTLFDRYQVTPHVGLHGASFTVRYKFNP